MQQDMFCIFYDIGKIKAYSFINLLPFVFANFSPKGNNPTS